MHSEGQVKVLVVDDHVAIRIGIASLIDAEQPRMGCVGAASTVHEALARTFELQPHVVVLDVNLDGEDGLALIPALHRAAPCTVVVLTSLADSCVAALALRQGAHACVHKTAPAADLIAAICAAHVAGDLPVGIAPANVGGGLSHAIGINRP
jgi:two-component system nitrate/nitrite response regulator NarL